jgi:multidrug efflux pump subunit AcrA (membrane-fusion protein)
VIAEFDTTEETYKLREAEADLAEAEQQVAQAENEARAKEEDLEYELISAGAELKQAELEVRRNPLLAAITAKQNLMDLEAARNKLSRLQTDYAPRKAALKASIAIQDAGRAKAKVQAETARKNIDMMTLKAPVDGYLNIERNTNTNFYYPGLEFPMYQVGDQVRPGMAVAQIPDLASYEASAQINEYDRGHLALGLDAELRVVALKGRLFRGKVKDLGGTTGPPWNRRFECKLQLVDPATDLRPGMSVKLVIKTDTIRNALWVPAQSLAESDGRTFVYVKAGEGFSARDVKLIRRGESQVVIEGLKEGDLVAMARPDEKRNGANKAPESASKAVSK